MTEIKIEIKLPQWTINALPAFLSNKYKTLEERMDLVLDLALQNIKHNTGGPFAAAVFNKTKGTLISVGVNLVVASSCSSAHAEVVAIALAQQTLKSYQLPNDCQLVVNWRPCLLCYGAFFWSSCRSLVIAGSSEELEDITGFNEGPIHPQWREELEKYNVEILDNICKAKAIELFHFFKQSKALVYNSLIVTQ